MKTFALCSGSSGNCFYVENDFGEKILVDFGISFRKAKMILKENNINIEDINAIFITHEHTDHTLGVKTLINKINCEVFATKGTGEYLKLKNFKIVKKNKKFYYKNFSIIALEKPHDAIEPVSYIFESNNKRLGIFTDLGYITPLVKDVIKTLDIIYFESNYCNNMLNKKASYSYIQRCLSDYGHLSTEESLKFLSENLNEDQIVILAHISENNNSYENVNFMFEELLKTKNKKIEYYISYQREPTQIIDKFFGLDKN